MGCSTSPRQGRDETAATPVPAPLRLHRTTVGPAWVDYNGHMSEWCYLLVMGDSSDAFFRYVGIDDAYRAAGASLFTVETHIRNLREASEGDELSLTLRILGLDTKRVHVAHEVIGPDGGLVATGEQMLLHVDARVGRAAALPAPLLGRLQRIADAHRVLPWPDWVGHVMRLPEDGERATPATEAGATWTSR
jgi:acyl-CoA thioester hydrolase